ncbi:MAG: hypothetical protein HFH36_06265 [Lachnospiraceae bacterium]|nr:hypothetical protein [Lachnospiraceae bacterium]
MTRRVRCGMPDDLQEPACRHEQRWPPVNRYGSGAGSGQTGSSGRPPWSGLNKAR